MDWDYGQRYWDAVDATWGTTMTRDGQVFEASYYADVYSGAATDGQHMTQWGSQYWAAHGNDVAVDRRPLLPEPCSSWAPRAAPSSERIVGVVGLDRTARPQGRRQARRGRAGAARARARTGAAPDSEAQFTLRNDGAQTGTWAVVTLVARGPGDQERDLGSVAHVTLKPGAYRLFTGHVKLDLRGSLARLADRRRRRGKLTLLDGGAPFQFVVGAPASHKR